MDCGVVLEKTYLGATGRTQTVRRKQQPMNGLGTTRGTPIGPPHLKNRAATLQFIMSLARIGPGAPRYDRR